MLVYRITLSKWADSLTGSGYPARWNSTGYFVIYTAESRALACLENLVHRSGEGLDRLFSLVEIRIDVDASSKTIKPSELPPDWHHPSQYPFCRKKGDQWLDQNKFLLLRVPSSIIPDEHNVLINPGHPEFQKVKINKIIPFRFDQRLKP